MEIKILTLKLRNFKKVKDLTIDFGDITTISGDNATGKTTVFDAFTWLLFGKNSSDAKDFNIKTLDANNNPIHKLEHEVSALIDVDGRHISLKKIFKEKWVKKKGAQIAELTGHETEHYMDEVPLSQGEYKARVDLLIKEELAKLITNPLYFNTQMKWNDRRNVLEAMAGEVTNESILNEITTDDNKDSVANLTNILNSGKNLSDAKKEIAVKKKRIKDSLETIPTRIDETTRMMPEVQDYVSIEKNIVAKQKEVSVIESQIEDKQLHFNSVYERIQIEQSNLNKLKLELTTAQGKRNASRSVYLNNIEGKISVLASKVAANKNKLIRIDNEIKRNNQTISNLTASNDALRKEWNFANATEVVIDEHSLNCPTCKQLLPEDQRNNTRETLTKNFNENKSRTLANIDAKGKSQKLEIERLTNLNNQLEQSKDQINVDIVSDEREAQNLTEDLDILKNKPSNPSDEELNLQKQIDDFVSTPAPVIDNTDLKSKREILNGEIDSLKQILTGKDQIVKLNARISELEAEEKTLSQELANLERMEFTMDAFTKAKVETLERRINNKFSLVKFKMFSQNLNGGEEECCECMVDGVPYTDVNTAGKINAGIDIINALCKHYNVSAPIWIDNRESIIRILPCDSQIINLQAVKDAPLAVVIEEKEFTAFA